MDSLSIDTGVKRISINGDPDRVIEFNPQDVLFAQKYYRCMAAFQAKEMEYKQKAIMLSKSEAVDEHGIPFNAEARLALIEEICDFTREQIDSVFGAGTSQIVFGDAQVIDAFAQFFNGMKRFIQPVRDAKVGRYINPSARPKHPKK